MRVSVKFYEFLDKAPPVGRLVVIEGTEQVLAERALEALLDRLLPPEIRDMNLVRLRGEEIGDASQVREAVAAMPFLAERRIVVAMDVHTLRAQERRALWEAAQSTPEGNTLVIVDLLSPRATRPQSFGTLAGQAALRIDTTASEEVRRRFIVECIGALGATAEPRAIAALVASGSDLASVSNDVVKVALSGRKITLEDLERESLVIADPKAYRYASALVEGKTSEAFAVAQELFALDPRGAAIPLLSALASEYALLWDLARPGGTIAARHQWRERYLHPVARRLGARRARSGYERAVHGVEAIVTGRSGSDPDDHRALVDRISAECAMLGQSSRRR